MVQEALSFKDISYVELWRPFCSAGGGGGAGGGGEPFCNFGKGHNEEQFSELNSNLGQWFRRRCHLKYFLSGVLRPFCSVERNHLYNFGIGHYEEQFCEIILNLDQWSGGNIIKTLFLSPLFGGAKPFVQFL